MTNVRTGLPAAGTLYVVATPIGNLGDLSAPARATLQNCDADRGRGHAPHGDAAQAFSASRRRCSRCTITTSSARAANSSNAARRRSRCAGERCRHARPSAIPGFESGARGARRRASRSSPYRGPARRLRRCRSARCRRIDFASRDFCRRAARRAARGCKRSKSEPRTLVLYESPHRVRETLEDCADGLRRRRAPPRSRARSPSCTRRLIAAPCASLLDARRGGCRFLARRNRAA